jgi:hypothetical protein
MNRLALLVAWCLALAACEDEGDPQGGTPNFCEAPEGEQGTPECHRYHARYCELVVACEVQDQCTCVADASSITCISDAEATRCADELESGSCAGPSAGCGLLEIADRDVAVAGCEQYVTAVCEFRERCHDLDPVECAAELHASFDCTMAVGLAATFDRCLADVTTLDCSQTSAPPSCDRVVRRAAP